MKLKYQSHFQQEKNTTNLPEYEFKEFKLNLPINKFQFLEELPYKQ